MVRPGIRVTLTLALLACFAVGSPAVAFSQRHNPPHGHKKDLREQVEALEDQWRTAQLADDPAAMDKLLSDDFVGITSNGEVVTKAQQLDRMRTRELMISSMSVSDVKVKLVGSVAIVTSRAEIEGTANGAPLNGSFRYTRVYQRLPNGAWKITNFEATRIPRPRLNQSAQNFGPTPGHP